MMTETSHSSDAQMCRQCKGLCCQGHPGVWVDPERFLPSSRSVAFLKADWAACDGYPEWLDYCEDLVYDLALRERYGQFAFAPRALVHFRPRSSWAWK